MDGLRVDLMRAIAGDELRRRIAAIPRDVLIELCDSAPNPEYGDRDAERAADRWLDRALAPHGITRELIEQVIGARAGAIDAHEAERRLEEYAGPALNEAFEKKGD